MKVILKNNVQDVLYCRFTSCRALCSTPGRLVHLIPTKREGRWDRWELFTIRDKNCQWSLFLDPLFKGILSGPEDATDNTFTLHLFLGMSPFNAPAHPGGRPLFPWACAHKPVLRGSWARRSRGSHTLLGDSKVSQAVTVGLPLPSPGSLAENTSTSALSLGAAGRAAPASPGRLS